MTSKLKTGKTLAAAAVAALLATTGTAQAQDSGPLTVKISGHVNRMLMYVDDGDKNTVFNSDNINSQTRLRFVGQKEFSPGWSAGVNWEVGWTSQPSSSVSFQDRDGNATSLNERHVDAFLISKQFGKLSLGQGDGAANGNIEIDLSGTTVIHYSSNPDIGSAFLFQDGAGNGPTIGATLNNFDFESRYDRVRYDTPNLGPLGLAVSYGNSGQNSVYEFAGRLATKIGRGSLAAGAGYSIRKNVSAVADDRTTIGGSVSYLDNSGLNVTLAYSNNDDDTPARRSKKFYYGKLGFKSGSHAISVDLSRGEDVRIDGEEATAYGIGYVFAPNTWLELYAGAKQHDLNTAGRNFDKITFVMAGTRIKF